MLFRSENVWYYDPDESRQNYWFFLKYALDIDPQLERWMTPIWLCERKILQAIDSELHLRHRASIEKIYKRSGAQTFSEVELYAYYSVHFLNRRYQRRPHGLAMTPYFEFSQVWHSTNRDICLGGQDDWDPDFWKQWPEINVDIKM